MEHIETIVDIIISEINEPLNLKSAYRAVKSHPLLRSEWKKLTLDEISILAYSVFFMDYQKAIREKDNIFFYIEVDFDSEETHYIDCEYCGGSGYEYCECDNGSQECSTCDGDGVVGDDNDECPNCEGAGNLICDECSGKGTIDCGNCDGDGTIHDGNKMDGITRLVMAYGNKKLIDKLKFSGGDLTSEFDEELNNLPQDLMLSIDSDSFTLYSEEDYSYDSDFSGKEVFYTVVDKEDRLEEVHIPTDF